MTLNSRPAHVKPETSNRNGYRYLPTITGLFTASLLIANVLNSKVLKVGSLPMTGGLMIFPVLYVFSDVLTEVHGYAESRKVIWTGLVSLILFVLMVEICGRMPADPSWPHQSAYEVILGRIPRIVAASILAYFVGEFGNSYLLAKTKLRTQGRRMSLRFVLSTVVGQFVDSSIFVLVAFVGVIPLKVILSAALTGWTLMVIWEITALPLTIPIVNALKRREQMDYFDTDTDFSPLRF